MRISDWSSDVCSFRSRHAVVVAAGRVALGAELDSGDIAQAYHRAVGRALQDHVAELIGRLKPALRRDGGVELLSGYLRHAADLTGRHLRVLRRARGCDLARHPGVARELVGAAPDPDGVHGTEQAGTDRRRGGEA